MNIMKVKACFDIDEEDLKELDLIAEKQERSRSWILRQAVKRYLGTE